MRLGDLDALKEKFDEYGEKAKFTQGACQQLINNAPTVESENIKPIANTKVANVKVEITEEEKQRIIEQLQGKRQTLIRLEAERPQGEWVFTDDDYGFWHCNQCKTVGSPHNNFCPNCGAKMGGNNE